MWLFIIGNGNRMLLEDDRDAEVECLDGRKEVFLIEPPLEGDKERMLSEAGLPCLSGSAVASLDIPGSRIFPVIDNVSDKLSSWLRRYAADPRPRSWVCRNHVGSFEPSDSAISSFDNSRSIADGGSTLARGDFDAFSAANCERGRARCPTDPLEVGRCCHESVPALEGVIAVLDGVIVSAAGLDGG